MYIVDRFVLNACHEYFRILPPFVEIDKLTAKCYKTRFRKLFKFGKY